MCFHYDHCLQYSITLISIGQTDSQSVGQYWTKSNMTEINLGYFNRLFDENFEGLTAAELTDIATQQLKTQFKTFCL